MLTTCRSTRKTKRRFRFIGRTGLKWIDCCGSITRAAGTPGRWSKDFSHPPVRNREFLGQNAGFPNHSHKVRVTNPAWHDVQMKVFADSRAGAMTEVHPHIEAFRLVQRGECTHSALRQLHHL